MRKSITFLIGLSFSTWRRHHSVSALKYSHRCEFSSVKEMSSINDYIKQIYGQTSFQRNLFSLFVTGGGISASQWLLTTPGASQCIQAVEVPYARAALSKQLETYISPQIMASISSLCSTNVAIHMAKAAYHHTIETIIRDHPEYLQNNEKINMFGIGVTAALATNNPKLGDHRCHIALYHAKGYELYTVILQKELRTRLEEDELCSQIILSVIGTHCDIPPFLPLSTPLTPLTPLTTHNTEDNTTSNILPTPPTYTIHHSSVKKSKEELLQEVCDKKLQNLLIFPKPPSLSSSSCSSSSSSSCSVIEDKEENWLFLEKPSTWPAFYPGIHTNTLTSTPTSTSTSTPASHQQPPQGNLFLFPGSFNPVHEGHISLVAASVHKYHSTLTGTTTGTTTSTTSTTTTTTTTTMTSTSTTTTTTTTTAAATTGAQVMILFELAVINADKPPLPLATILHRLSQFDWYANPLFQPLFTQSPLSATPPVIGISVTMEPLFTQKIQLFPGATLLLGADTFVRLLDTKYYHPKSSSISGQQEEEEEEEEMTRTRNRNRKEAFAKGNLIKAIHQIECYGGKFYVAGRVAQQSTMKNENGFDSMESLRAQYATVDEMLSLFPSEMFESISEEEFRVDISSTILRQRAAAASATVHSTAETIANPEHKVV